MKKVLVTGGLGYIGSHTAVELINKGYEVVIIDDLSNSSVKILNRIEQITSVKPEFHQIDLRNKKSVLDFFANHNISNVIHFAASKAVGESVENPLKYYENNISAFVSLLQELQKKGRFNFIFSSSCTVYGEPDFLPISENDPVKKAESPYGNTKKIGEEILHDLAKVYDYNAVILRYFNPIGAHESHLIGELPIGVPQNLVPFITQTAAGIREQLSVFGNDYPTSDGTCVRDYIHVVDLAKAHVIALERIMNNKNIEKIETFNIGTGQGNSVLNIINTFEEVNNLKLNYKISPRRKGDVISVYANTDKANSILGWTASKSIKDALKDSWEWQKNLEKNPL